MNAERNILKRLYENCTFEDDTLDEKTYTVGDTQYWKRGGKTYKWTQSGGRQECSEDEYYKALSGGTSGNDVVKNTDPSNDKARVSSGVDKDYSNVKLGDEIKWQGKSYTLIDDENEEGSLIFRPTEMVTDDAFDGYGDASDDIYLDRSQLKPKSSEPMVDKGKKYKDMYAKATADYEKSLTKDDKEELDKINKHSAKRSGEYMAKLYHDAMHPNDNNEPKYRVGDTVHFIDKNAPNKASISSIKVKVAKVNPDGTSELEDENGNTFKGSKEHNLINPDKEKLYPSGKKEPIDHAKVKMKPDKITSQGKTFKVKDGVITMSMYDTNKRISAVNKFAKENGYKVEYEESSKKKSEPTTAKDEIKSNLIKKYGDKVTLGSIEKIPNRNKPGYDAYFAKGYYKDDKGRVNHFNDLMYSKSNNESEPEMPKGMRTVQTPAGEMYRVDSKSGSDFIQINPTGKGKYELVVYDNGSLSPTDKKQDLSKEDAFKLAKDAMDKSEYYKTGKVSSIDKRRNEFYDDSESDYVNYDGVKNFDHTTWDIDGYETTIKRNDSGRGYYLQNEDFDMEFDTKGDLVDYLKDNEASFAGYDSENDY